VEPRVALVTGGSGALGHAVAKTLDKLGLSVAVHFHGNADAARAVTDDLSNPTTIVQADLADWSSAAAMEETVRAELGTISVLVNCGAVRKDGLMATQSPAEWAEVIGVNLIGTFHACRAVVPRMLMARSGCIVNVVSPAGIMGSEGQTAYSSSKAGVIGLTRSLALECAKRRVTVNALSPGFMDTEITRSVPAAVRERIIDRVPLRRVAEPDEVARGVTFLLESPFVTGQVLSIDGGMTV
jgi:3-oxoacyl-[acyl-carrier protein] reductase